MTPKSLLRHKRAVSNLSEMGPGSTFHRVYWDDLETRGDKSLLPDEKIRRVVLCSGKVYYDLFEEREKMKRKGAYLLRLEQLYPFPKRPLAKELARFPNAEVYWCQEEPQNMGAWWFVKPRIEQVLKQLDHKCAVLKYAGRPESAATATGLLRVHNEEQSRLLREALGGRAQEDRT